MTLPRRVLPNRTYLITRRCSERRFFLRPDPQVTSIFEYLLALACERHGVEVHGFVCMSNHYHLVVTDPEARLPEFQQYLNGLLARAVNCARGRWEAFWNRDSYNAVELLDDTVVLEKLAYTLLTPCALGWSGARVRGAGPPARGKKDSRSGYPVGLSSYAHRWPHLNASRNSSARARTNSQSSSMRASAACRIKRRRRSGSVTSIASSNAVSRTNGSESNVSER